MAEIQLQIRRDTAANWGTNNPVLAGGEWGLETDTNLLKMGDGVTAYWGVDYVPLNNNVYQLSEWTSADTDIDGLIDGSAFGFLLEGRNSGHFTVGLRDNDTLDGFQIITGSGNYTSDSTYDLLAFEVKAGGQGFFGNQLEVTSSIKLTGPGSSFDINRTENDQTLVISGGSSSALGGSLHLAGSTHAALAGDIALQSSGNTVMYWDESTGTLSLNTGTGTKTTAALLDASQNLTVFGSAVIAGNQLQVVPSTGISQFFFTSDTACQWLLADSGATSGERNMLVQLANEELTWAWSNDAYTASTAFLTVTRSANVADLIDLQADQVNLGNFEFDADQSVGASQDDYVLTYNDTTGLISLEATATGDGIDDQATGERVELTDTYIRYGSAVAASGWQSYRAVNDGIWNIAGGNGPTAGSNIILYGGTATLANDMRFRAGTNSFLVWDESVGDLEILTGTGLKTSTATFAGSGITTTTTIIAPAATTSLAPMRIPHGTAPTSPTDGDMWTTTAGLYVRINGSTVGPLS